MGVREQGVRKYPLAEFIRALHLRRLDVLEYLIPSVQLQWLAQIGLSNRSAGHSVECRHCQHAEEPHDEPHNYTCQSWHGVVSHGCIIEVAILYAIRAAAVCDGI